MVHSHERIPEEVLNQVRAFFDRHGWKDSETWYIAIGEEKPPAGEWLDAGTGVQGVLYYYATPPSSDSAAEEVEAFNRLFEHLQFYAFKIANGDVNIAYDFFTPEEREAEDKRVGYT